MRQIDLDEDVLHLAELRRCLVNFVCQAQGVDRVNQIKLPYGVLHLVRLQVPDQVPFHLAVQGLRLVQSLLHAVLTDVHNPRVDCLLHRRHGMILRHGNELHRCILAHTGTSFTRRRDPRVHLANMLCNHRIVTHLSSITAANRPVLPPSAR